ARLSRVRGQEDAQVRGELTLPERDHLQWPFFDDTHRKLALDLPRWAFQELTPLADGSDDADSTCRKIVGKLGDGGWLRYCVPAPYGGAFRNLDVRSLCLCRETLAQHSGLADFAFAMQGLGAGPISLYGPDELRKRYLPGVRTGKRIAAFAISEAEAGSDVVAMRTSARRTDGGWVLDGEKTFISNAGIADHYVVFARLPEEGERAFGAFVVEADAKGFSVTERIETLAPHPLGTITFDGCKVQDD